jgi:hypothetical protein
LRTAFLVNESIELKIPGNPIENGNFPSQRSVIHAQRGHAESSAIAASVRGEMFSVSTILQRIYFAS